MGDCPHFLKSTLEHSDLRKKRFSQIFFLSLFLIEVLCLTFATYCRTYMTDNKTRYIYLSIHRNVFVFYTFHNIQRLGHWHRVYHTIIVINTELSLGPREPRPSWPPLPLPRDLPRPPKLFQSDQMIWNFPGSSTQSSKAGIYSVEASDVHQQIPPWPGTGWRVCLAFSDWAISSSAFLITASGNRVCPFKGQFPMMKMSLA